MVLDVNNASSLYGSGLRVARIGPLAAGYWLLATNSLLLARSKQREARSQNARHELHRSESQTTETFELDEDNIFLDLSTEYIISIKW